MCFIMEGFNFVVLGSLGDVAEDSGCLGGYRVSFRK